MQEAFRGLRAEGDFYQGDAERLPEIVPPQHFDLVYSFGVIHHTPRPEQVIAHIREHYMGPESELRLMLYSKWCWKTLWIVASYGKGAFWKAPELIATHSEAQTGCPVTFTYTFNELRQGLLKDFRVDVAREGPRLPLRDREVREVRVRADVVLPVDAAGPVPLVRAPGRLAHDDQGEPAGRSVPASR